MYAPKVIVASATGSRRQRDLDLRSAMCDSALSERACSDRRSVVGDRGARSPGTYYLLVESKTNWPRASPSTSSSSPAKARRAPMSATAAPASCAASRTGATTMSCEKPVCNDGVDDDGDGKLDFPDDPGCTSATDSDETDDCPSGPELPGVRQRHRRRQRRPDRLSERHVVHVGERRERSLVPQRHGQLRFHQGPDDDGRPHERAQGHHVHVLSSSTGNDASLCLALPAALSSLTVDTEGSAVSDTVRSSCGRAHARRRSRAMTTAAPGDPSRRPRRTSPPAPTRSRSAATRARATRRVHAERARHDRRGRELRERARRGARLRRRTRRARARPGRARASRRVSATASTTTATARSTTRTIRAAERRRRRRDRRLPERPELPGVRQRHRRRRRRSDRLSRRHGVPSAGGTSEASLPERHGQLRSRSRARRRRETLATRPQDLTFTCSLDSLG